MSIWCLWCKKWNWAGFVYDFVALFVNYHSTTAVYLFTQIWSNIRHGCSDTISTHCDSKKKIDPFHNSLRQNIKTRYCPQTWSLSQHRMKFWTFLCIQMSPLPTCYLPGLASLLVVCHSGFVWRRSVGTFLSDVEVKFEFKFRNAVLVKILVLFYVVLCAVKST